MSKKIKNKILLSTLVFIYAVVNGCSQSNPADTLFLNITPSPTSTNTSAPTLTQKLSTLQLINQAYINGEINAEYRLLYLAYALYEYESLPTRFRGNAGWRGSSAIMELYKVDSDPSAICSMSPHVRSEFQRIFNLDPKNCN